jgi:GH25 family lysozyme M1 (1,4-beta-N-acetylmuramidase)
MASIPDISNNNGGTVNWAEVKSAGAPLGICKASEGTTYGDPTLVQRFQGMAAVGLARGAYHFAHPSTLVDGNANKFSSMVQAAGFNSQDRKILDMEVYEGSPQQIVTWAIQWAQLTAHITSEFKPLFYTYEGFLNWLGSAANALVSTFDLWIADYGATPRTSPWPSYALWQDTDAGTEPGITGKCDLSVANGNYFQAKPVAPAGISNLNKPIVGAVIGSQGAGYTLAAGDGGIFAFQDAFYGSVGGTPINAAVVGIASTASQHGYWLAAEDGGVFSFGDATFDGSEGGQKLSEPVVGIASEPGGGYYLVAKDGGIFSFGAAFHGSLAGQGITDVVGMAVRPQGDGYWLAAADGGVFALGGAPYDNSLPGEKITPNAPIVGIAATPSGNGYWLVGADGGVFTFGDAPSKGSLGAEKLSAPIVGVVGTPSGQGYYLVGADGGVFTFGDAAFHGSLG